MPRTHTLGNTKGGNTRTNPLSIFHPYMVPMGSDFTFQTDVTTAASLARHVLMALMNNPTLITRGHWSEGSLPCAPDFSGSAWNHKMPQTTTNSSGMPLLRLLNSVQTLSKQKASTRLEWVTTTEGCYTLGVSKSSFEPVSSWATRVPSSLPGAPSAGCKPVCPALGPGIRYSHQFYISPISINI